MEILAQTMPIRIRIAYVRQEDLFFLQLTVQETLSLAAELRLLEKSSSVARLEYVNSLLFKLGLVSCADTNVGDMKVRGISGGEKKCLSVACELIASPYVIFADEPIGNLDFNKLSASMFTIQPLRHAEKTYKTERIVEATWNELLFSEPEKKLKSICFISK